MQALRVESVRYRLESASGLAGVSTDTFGVDPDDVDAEWSDGDAAAAASTWRTLLAEERRRSDAW